eukprot:2552492-Alexandrium_andersonii.AAC.1
MPSQRLVIQREVRLRGPGTLTKREVRAVEEDICIRGMRDPRRALSQLSHATRFRELLRPGLESYLLCHPEFESYLQGLMGGCPTASEGGEPSGSGRERARGAQ